MQIGAGILSAEIEDTVGAGLSEDESDLVLRAGGGLDLSLGESLYLNVDVAYDLGSGDLEELDYLTVTAGLGVRL